MDSSDCHVVVIPLGIQRKPYELQSLIDCNAIRESVFIEEQGVPREIEQDGRDNESGHILLWNTGIPVGTLRYRKTEEGVKLERIAILPAYRGKHLGKILIREGIRSVRMNQLEEPIYIHAQEHATSFYASLGFREGDEHTIEAGIRHVTMHISRESELALFDTDPHCM